jgi:hypothetical protein
MKISFSGEGFVGQFLENGEFDLPIESNLPHRFELKDGVVLDKYDGVTDDQVKVIDHERAIAYREELIVKAKDEDEAEGNIPAELPALGAVAAAEDNE